MADRFLSQSSNFYSPAGSNNAIKLEPSDNIKFESIRPGNRYVTSFILRNTTDTPQRIRIKPPRTSIFSLIYLPGGAIAPGLEVRAEIECLIPEDAVDFIFTETITASMGPHTLDIPICASKISARVVFENYVNLGVSTNGDKELMREILFENKGEMPGSVEFRFVEDSKMKMRPTKFELQPYGTEGSQQKVKCFYESKDVGVRREAVQVVVTGGAGDYSSLELTAEVVRPKLSLLADNKKGLLDAWDFGSIFFGEKKTAVGILVNNGPQPLSYSVTYADEEQKSPQTEDKDDSRSYAKSLVISPLDGIIKPFSERIITISFEPEIREQKYGFEKQFIQDVKDSRIIARKVYIDCPEIDQRISLNLQGAANVPLVLMSPSVIRFGTCPVYDRRDIRVQLCNKSDAVTSFSFPKTAHFKMYPPKGVIQALQTQSAVLSFQPSQMGTFKSIIQLNISNGLSFIDIKVFGESEPPDGKKKTIGGIDKVLGDFEKTFKFVDPAKILIEKLENEKIKGASVLETASLTSSDRDRIYGMDSVSTALQPVVSDSMLAYSDNRKTYNDYLKTQGQTRLMNKTAATFKKSITLGAADRTDPGGVDMGMERGLDEPRFKMPVADESVWLAKQVTEGRARTKLPTDENKLTPKKFKESPVIADDVKHCTAELSAPQLALVTVSHKAINFGQVCVGSSSSKSLSILNELSTSVIVRLEGLSSDLKQSLPLSQVIPGGSTVAGFDITFCGKTLGKARSTFSWILNNQYYNIVTVLADVVPIELNISKEMIAFEFNQESVEPNVIDSILITNPGNSQAEFSLSLLPGSAFVCRPEKGLVPPGRSLSIAIVWAPKVGKKNEAEVTLNIPGGSPRTFKLEGKLPDMKVQFDSKLLQIGVIAVGNEAHFAAKLKNTGSGPAVFFVSQGEDSDIQVTPDTGLIPPGESFPLKVKMFPKAPSLFDDLQISCTLRGSKTVSLKLAGQAVIPQVKLIESSFPFGQVTVGCECRIPLTLVNESPITVDLILDLTKYPDFAPLISAPGKNTSAMLLEIPFFQEDEVGNSMELLGADSTSSEKSNRKRKNVWKISVMVGATLSASLYFKPSKAATHDLKLPMHCQGMSSSLLFPVPVTAVAVSPRLALSTTTVDFGDRVVSRDPTSRSTYCKELTLTNLEKNKVISYDIKDFLPPAMFTVGPAVGLGKSGGVVSAERPPPIFFVTPVKGELQPGQTVTIFVTFLPQDSGNSSNQMDIYVKGQTDPSRPYLSFTCRGVGSYPRLTFSKHQLDLPTVPLGITSTASFWVINQGYGNLELKHRVSPTIPIDLDVSYPDGPDIGLTNKRVRVVVSSQSNQPVSWAGKIEFLDPDGERFSIIVYGCTDNSIMTNYPFLQRFSSSFGFLNVEGQAIKYLNKDEIKMLLIKEREYKESLSEYLKESERLEQEILLGKIPAKTVKHSKDGKDGNGSQKTKPSVSRHEPEKPTYLMGQSSNQFSPNYNSSYREVDNDWKNEMKSYLDVEAIVLLKWLNKFVCKKQFTPDRFPECIFDSYGDLFVDLVEVISGRKIPGVKPGPGEEPAVRRADTKDGAGPTRPTGRLSVRIAGALRMSAKFGMILSHLISGGALLNHINAVDLLKLEDHLLAQEVDLRKSEGDRMTPATLLEQRGLWETSWRANCCFGWMEVLIQALKIYTISRCTYKDFQQLPGVVEAEADLARTENLPVPPGRGPVAPKSSAGKKGSSNLAVPPMLTNSNVYSQQESVLLSWASLHVQRANGLKRPKSDNEYGALQEVEEQGEGEEKKNSREVVRIVDVEGYFKNYAGFCQLVHSHKPDFCKSGGPLHGYALGDNTHANFKRFQDSLEKVYLSLDVTAEQMACSGRSLLLVLAHLYLNLPSLLPKEIISFQGVLGANLSKMVELSNPSQKKVGYTVSVDGSEEFSIARRDLVLLPDSTLNFPITLKPVFSSPAATGTVTFLGCRDLANGISPGATMVFQLNSMVVGRRPIEKVLRNVPLFELDSVQIVISNPFLEEGNFYLNLSMVCKGTSAEALVQAVLKAGRPAERGNKKKAPAEVLNYSPIPQPTPAAPKGPNGRAIAEAPAKTEEEIEIEAVFKEPYWYSGDSSLILPPGGSKTVTIHFLPFALGTHNCQIILLDPSLGEFSYDIQSEVGLPKSSEAVDFHAEVEEGMPVKKALKVSAKNINFEKALTTATDMRVTSSALAKKKARETLVSILATPITDEDNSTSRFTVAIQSPFLTCAKDLALATDYGSLLTVLPARPGTNPTGLTISTPKGGQQRSNNSKKAALKSLLLDPTDLERSSGTNGLSTVLFSFSAEKAGSYTAKFILYASDNQLDIRIIELFVQTTVPLRPLTLFFKGPARQDLVQEIPIQNTSDTDWSLTASIQGAGFSGVSSVSVPKGATVTYAVQFKGLQEGLSEGVLILKNTRAAEDSFEYNLRGEAEEPLAEDHLRFNCEARSREIFSIRLQQVKRSASAFKLAKTKGTAANGCQVFSVSTDIPLLTGEAEVSVPPSGGKYDFQYFSSAGGVTSGCVTFTDVETGAVVWYTVEVEVTSPQAESVIDVTSQVRKAVAVEITLENPSSEECSFTVNIEGPGLIGDDFFRLPARNKFNDANSSGKESKESKSRRDTYELIYSPLHSGEFTGRISFSNPKMGQFWYVLNLFATPAVSTVLDDIECMVGSSVTVSVPVENPLANAITMVAAVKDTIGNFSISPDKLTLGPYEQSSFELTFRPSSLTETAQTTVILSNPSYGESVYEVSGVGLLPGLMPSVKIFSPLGEIGSHTIVFRNPFPFPLPLDILLTDTDADQYIDNDRDYRKNIKVEPKAFTLLLRKSTDIVIPPKGMQQIGVSFVPERLGEYSASVQLRSAVSGRSLLWCYPLTGMADSGSAQLIATLVTPCKSSLVRDIEVRLDGMRRADIGPSDAEPDLSDFSIETVVDPRYKDQLARALRILPVQLIETDEEMTSPLKASSNFKLKYRVLFEPLKTLNASVEVIISCRDRGRWRVIIDLEGTEPAPDDSIKLVAAVGSTDKVTFKLSNRFLGYSSFQAYFSAKSSVHFSVSPTSGVLAPFGAEGTPFVVSFSPLGYGNKEMGNLIVTTDEVQWNYQVTGSYPDHIGLMQTNIKNKSKTKGGY